MPGAISRDKNEIEMTNRLLHITLHFRARAPKPETLEAVFDDAEDWIQYAPGCWLLWTSRTAESWYKRLESTFGDKDYALIFRIELEEYSGLLPKFAWDWLARYVANKVEK